MLLSQTRAMVLVILVLMVGLSAGLSEKRVIKASEVEAAIRAGEPAEFDNCIIVGGLNLSRLKTERPVHFNFTIFQDFVTFHSAALNSTAYFRGSKFNGVAEFGGSVFNRPVDFIVSGFNGNVNFGNSAFNGHATFMGSIFNGNADFWKSAFNGDADFTGSTFNGDANFAGSVFNGSAFFWASVFNGNANFRGSAFYGIATFITSKFNKDAFFYGTSFKKELDLTLTEYNRLYIRWGRDNHLVYDDTAYQLLTENLKKLGFIMDADNCYYQFRVAQFWHQNPFEDPFLYVFNFGAWIFYGFGKRPTYPLIWSIFSIGIFGFFWIAAGLASPKDAIGKYDLANGLLARVSSLFLILIISIIGRVSGLKKSRIEIDEYDQAGRWPGTIKEAFIFSARVFLSGTKFFIDPPDVPVLPGISQALIIRAFLFERLLGAFFSILLFLAIGATIVRQ
jgi:hypothetical protein